MTSPVASPAAGGSAPAEPERPGAGMHTARRRVVMGPDHPATRGAVSLVLDLDGERVDGVEVDIGLGHRGVEKELESRPWYQAVPFAERIAPESGVLPALAFCLAVERLVAIEAPERAQWLRVLASEIARVGDHLGRLAWACRGLGAGAEAAWLLDARELALGWMDRLAGARIAGHYVRLGGVARALPAALVDALRAESHAVLRLVADAEIMLTRSRVCVERLRGAAPLDRATCQAFGASGVLLRAAGLPADLRKGPGYAAYAEIDFDVPVGSVGDDLDRLLVCMEEIRQSVRIAVQCIDRLEALGPGPHRSDDERLGWPDASRGGEGIRTGITEGPRVPEGDAYAAVESSNGELGFFVVSDGSGVPVRVRCRAPGFFHAQLLPGLLTGQRLADVPTTLALVNVSGPECDR